MALLDMLQDVCPGKLDEACGGLLAEPVGEGRLRTAESRLAGGKGVAWRVVYTTGEPVEEPEGGWRRCS